MRVLIAEDSQDIAEVVAFRARMVWPDCEVAVAGSGEEALELFREGEPDLVVLDIRMPPPDGFEVLGRIREISRVPVLMLTVRDSEAERERARELCADDYLTKPFDPADLLTRLRALAPKTAEP